MRSLSLTIDLDEIITKLVNRLSKIMAISKVSIYLKTEESEKVKVYETSEQKENNEIIFYEPDKNDPFFVSLIEQEKINTEEFMINYYLKISEELEKRKISLSLPLIVQNRLIGILNLGNKKFEDEFSQEDIFLLETISTQASIAIDNAISYKKLEKAYKELKNTQEELIKAEKLSTIGRMASSIIHDVKTPITSIIGFAQLIGFKTENKLLQEYTKQIIRSAEQMHGMIQEILDFAKGKEKELNKKKHNLEEIIDEAVLELKNYLEHNNIKLKLVRDFNNSLYLDKQKVVRVLYNVIKNAIESMPDGGRITIKTYPDNNNAVISITDTGKGIHPEIKNKIFEPFFSNGKNNGTGLGLSIVKKIVEAHKGKISVESNPGKGTTFFISFPIIKDIT
ncbi:hypothetical protein DRQ09_03620 [candidate division KSB1 bacterium]|nr:MAG: hypothetical protein DRQ09_03620 [candidate division KSB1 bacterium]